MMSDMEIVKGFNPDERLIRARQAAEMLGLPQQTLGAWRHRKNTGQPAPDLPFVKIGRAVRYRLSDVRRFIEMHRSTQSDLPAPGADLGAGGAS